MNRAPWIDGLRFLAAASVFAFHALYHRPETSQPDFIQAMAKYGYLGVSAFFMISGYVITLSAEGRTRRGFARARIVRLWPAFLIAAFLTEAALAYDGRALSAPHFLANLTMLPRLLRVPYLDAVYWSLMYEIVFYAYVTILVGPRFVERLRIVCWAWLALSMANRFFPVPFAAQLLLDCAPYFATGIAIYFVRKEARIWDRLLLVASVLLAMVNAIQQRLAMGTPPPDPVVVVILVALSAAALFWATTAKSRSPGLLIALGGVSYPLYLVHNEIGATLEHRLPLAVAAACVLVLAAAVWRVELIIRARLSQPLLASASRTPREQRG